ncbi:MAG: hypothetical protein ACLP1X_05100 [Polyangiaceae bacterium]|jgi:hypothetical protein
MSLVGSAACGGHDPGEETGRLKVSAPGPLSVEATAVAVGGVGDGDVEQCGVTLVATLVFHGTQRIDGTASLAQPIPFAIPAAIPVTTGGTKDGQAQLQFSAEGGAPVTCSYDLHGGGPSFPLSGCDDGAAAGGIESADSFVLHIQTADHGADATGSEIQLTTALDAPDGTACAGANSCFQAYACQAGTCTGSNPVLCTSSDQCHAVGTCDPSSGACSNPSAPDGTACNDGNTCTQTDSCQTGTCLGANPVTCMASDACHVAGTCDPTSGVCSNPSITGPEAQVCNAGSCVAGCSIGGTFYAPAATDPANPCLSCNPSVTTTGWDGNPDECCVGASVVFPMQGTSTDCAPYACELTTSSSYSYAQTPACTTTCTSASDCSTGSACQAVPSTTGGVETFCATCGVSGGPVCTTGPACLPGCGAPGGCIDDGTTCLPCGLAGDYCCESNGTGTCNANLTCNGDSACQCGYYGEACCDGTTCSGSGLSCDNGVCNCGGSSCACGLADQPCCSPTGGGCETGLTCAFGAAGGPLCGDWGPGVH